MILLIDNYDSFVFNLRRYFERLGCETVVVRNDKISLGEVVALQPHAVVMSPGPCMPNEAGICLELVRELSDQLPMLGVCLGHQVIAQALGGRIVRAREPMHGQSSRITHNGQGVFRNLASPLDAARYHSLVVDHESLPEELEITARSEVNEIMALAHRRFPLVGVQFHPESILTSLGFPILSNFLQIANIATAADRDYFSDELSAPATNTRKIPSTPVTF